MNKLTKLPKNSALQFAYSFHKFIHNERDTEDWNKLDEEAYQAALTGVFEFEERRSLIE